MFGIPDDEWGERVHAIVQAKPGRDHRPRRAPGVRGVAARALQAAPRVRGPRRAAAHRLGQAAEAGPARRVLARPRRRLPRSDADPLGSRVETAPRGLRRSRCSTSARRATPTRPRRGRRARFPGGREAVRRHDRAQDRARAGPARAARRRGGTRRGRRAARGGRVPTTARSSSSSRRWCAGTRELIAGLVRDPQFGPCVMFGVGGVLAEALGDVAFRLVPLTELDAGELLDDLATQKLLGPFRGEPAVDRARRRGHAASACRGSRSNDPTSRRSTSTRSSSSTANRSRSTHWSSSTRAAGAPPWRRPRPAPARATPRSAALFEPRGVIVAGASTHPGQVRLRRAAQHPFVGVPGPGRRHEPRGDPGARHRYGTRHRRAARRPLGSRVRLHARRARTPICCARMRTAGRARCVPHERGLRRGGRRGPARRATSWSRWPTSSASCSPGPNGQGVVSTPAAPLRADRRAVPAAGADRDREPVGKLRLVVRELGRADGRRREPRGVRAGNAAAVSIADYLDWYADDDATAVSLAYVEGVDDGRALFDRLAAVARRKPVVLVKGGTTASGQRAAASHTGSLAADDRIFDGMCRQAGITRAATVEEAFEAAATFATQPLPRGPRTAVLTTAGGWGVVTADAIARAPGLELAALPADLRAAIDEKLPPRWSRNNPIDFAGGETRDTIPEVMELVARHPDIDAIVYLGLGIQSNQAPAAARRRVLSRPRPRAHRRVPRAPGRAIRRGGRGDLRRDRQADPHRNRAGGRRARQSGARRRSARPAASAIPARTARWSRSRTSGTTRASGSRVGCREVTRAQARELRARRARVQCRRGPPDRGCARPSTAAPIAHAGTAELPHTRFGRRGAFPCCSRARSRPKPAGARGRPSRRSSPRSSRRRGRASRSTGAPAPWRASTSTRRSRPRRP